MQNYSFKQIHKDRIFDNLTVSELTASQLTTGNVMFQNGAGLQHNIGTVPQEGSLISNVTLDSICGSITLYDIIPAGVSTTFLCYNTLVKSTSVILLTVDAESSDDSLPSLASVSNVQNGYFRINIKNLDPTNATTYAPKINFYIINPIV